MSLLASTLLLISLSNPSASDVLKTASKLAMELRYVEASVACLEVATRDDLEESVRYEAITAALGYADIAVEETGDSAPLCRAHSVLVTHEVTDHEMLRPNVERRLEAIVGTDWRETCEALLHESEDVETTSAPEPHGLLESPVTPTPPPRRPATAATEITDRSTRPRALLVAGATLTTVGAVYLAGMTTSLYLWDRNTRELRELTAKAETTGKTDETNARAQELRDSSRVLKPIAISAGVVGSAAIVSGLVMLAVSHRRSRRFALIPTASPRAGGITILTRF